MANRNYEFGVKETIVNQLISQLALDTRSGMKLDLIYDFAMANVTLSTDEAGLSPVPASAYDLEIDSTYTTNEAKDGGTGSTVNKAITITNATYAGVDLYISGDNFGSYTDNDIVQTQINSLLENTAQMGVGDSIVRHGTGDRGDGLLYSDGRALSRGGYFTLFQEIGTEYGVGDGSTTFNIPAQSDYPTTTEISLVWHIKAEAILSSGEPVSAEVYPWEELGRTAWQNQAININHGLGIDKRYLDIKVELKKTGTVDIWQEIKQVMFDNITGVAYSVGIAIDEVDNNNITIRTGLDGAVLINPATGGLTLLQAVAGDIRVTITKPNLLANQLIVPDDVTINDAVHVTKTFPAISELIGTRTYTRSGTGTGKFTLNVPAGGVVDWGDAEVVDGSVVLEGVGKVVIRASGGKYKIDEYEDYITDGANQQIWKYKDGTEKQIILQSYIGVISVVAGVLFRTSSFALLTRYHDFLSLDNETVSIVSSTAPYVWAAIGTILSSITNPLRPHILSGIAYGSNTSIVSINSIGRWRT